MIATIELKWSHEKNREFSKGFILSLVLLLLFVGNFNFHAKSKHEIMCPKLYIQNFSAQSFTFLF